MNVAGRNACADALPTPHGRLAQRLDDFRREGPRSGEVSAVTVEGPKDPHSRHRRGERLYRASRRTPAEVAHRRTSAVAVCCSSTSRVSVISRAFSIAMTASRNFATARSACEKTAAPLGGSRTEMRNSVPSPAPSFNRGSSSQRAGHSGPVSPTPARRPGVPRRHAAR